MAVREVFKIQETSGDDTSVLIKWDPTSELFAEVLTNVPVKHVRIFDRVGKLHSTVPVSVTSNKSNDSVYVLNIDWDYQGNFLAVHVVGTGSIPLWIRRTKKTTRIETDFPTLSCLAWSNTTPEFAAGTSNGHLFFYNAKTLNRNKIVGKHTKCVTAIAWSLKKYPTIVASLAADRLVVSRSDGSTLSVHENETSCTGLFFSICQLPNGQLGSAVCTIGQTRKKMSNVDKEVELRDVTSLVTFPLPIEVPEGYKVKPRSVVLTTSRVSESGTSQTRGKAVIQCASISTNTKWCLVGILYANGLYETRRLMNTPPPTTKDSGPYDRPPESSFHDSPRPSLSQGQDQGLNSGTNSDTMGQERSYYGAVVWNKQLNENPVGNHVVGHMATIDAMQIPNIASGMNNALSTVAASFGTLSNVYGLPSSSAVMRFGNCSTQSTNNGYSGSNKVILANKEYILICDAKTGVPIANPLTPNNRYALKLRDVVSEDILKLPDVDTTRPQQDGEEPGDIKDVQSGQQRKLTDEIGKGRGAPSDFLHCSNIAVSPDGATMLLAVVPPSPTSTCVIVGMMSSIASVGDLKPGTLAGISCYSQRLVGAVDRSCLLHAAVLVGPREVSLYAKPRLFSLPGASGQQGTQSDELDSYNRAVQVPFDPTFLAVTDNSFCVAKGNKVVLSIVEQRDTKANKPNVGAYSSQDSADILSYVFTLAGRGASSTSVSSTVGAEGEGEAFGGAQDAALQISMTTVREFRVVAIRTLDSVVLFYRDAYDPSGNLECVKDGPNKDSRKLRIMMKGQGGSGVSRPLLLVAQDDFLAVVYTDNVCLFVIDYVTLEQGGDNPSSKRKTKTGLVIRKLEQYPISCSPFSQPPVEYNTGPIDITSIVNGCPRSVSLAPGGIRLVVSYDNLFFGADPSSLTDISTSLDTTTRYISYVVYTAVTYDSPLPVRAPIGLESGATFPQSNDIVTFSTPKYCIKYCFVETPLQIDAACPELLLDLAEQQTNTQKTTKQQGQREDMLYRLYNSTRLSATAQVIKNNTKPSFGSLLIRKVSSKSVDGRGPQTPLFDSRFDQLGNMKSVENALLCCYDNTHERDNKESKSSQSNRPPKGMNNSLFADDEDRLSSQQGQNPSITSNTTALPALVDYGTTYSVANGCVQTTPLDVWADINSARIAPPPPPADPGFSFETALGAVFTAITLGVPDMALHVAPSLLSLSLTQQAFVTLAVSKNMLKMERNTVQGVFERYVHQYYRDMLDAHRGKLVIETTPLDLAHWALLELHTACLKCLNVSAALAVLAAMQNSPGAGPLGSSSTVCRPILHGRRVFSLAERALFLRAIDSTADATVVRELVKALLPSPVPTHTQLHQQATTDTVSSLLHAGQYNTALCALCDNGFYEEAERVVSHLLSTQKTAEPDIEAAGVSQQTLKQLSLLHAASLEQRGETLKANDIYVRLLASLDQSSPEVSEMVGSCIGGVSRTAASSGNLALLQRYALPPILIRSAQGSKVSQQPEPLSIFQRIKLLVDCALLLSTGQCSSSSRSPATQSSQQTSGAGMATLAVVATLYKYAALLNTVVTHNPLLPNLISSLRRESHGVAIKDNTRFAPGFGLPGDKPGEVQDAEVSLLCTYDALYRDTMGLPPSTLNSNADPKPEAPTNKAPKEACSYSVYNTVNLYNRCISCYIKARVFSEANRVISIIADGGGAAGALVHPSLLSKLAKMHLVAGNHEHAALLYRRAHLPAAAVSALTRGYEERLARGDKGLSGDQSGSVSSVAADKVINSCLEIITAAEQELTQQQQQRQQLEKTQQAKGSRQPKGQLRTAGAGMKDGDQNNQQQAQAQLRDDSDYLQSCHALASFIQHNKQIVTTALNSLQILLGPSKVEPMFPFVLVDGKHCTKYKALVCSGVTTCVKMYMCAHEELNAYQFIKDNPLTSLEQNQGTLGGVVGGTNTGSAGGGGGADGEGTNGLKTDQATFLFSVLLLHLTPMSLVPLSTKGPKSTYSPFEEMSRYYRKLAILNKRALPHSLSLSLISACLCYLGGDLKNCIRLLISTKNKTAVNTALEVLANTSANDSSQGEENESDGLVREVVQFFRRGLDEEQNTGDNSTQWHMFKLYLELDSPECVNTIFNIYDATLRGSRPSLRRTNTMNEGAAQRSETLSIRTLTNILIYGLNQLRNKYNPFDVYCDYYSVLVNELMKTGGGLDGKDEDDDGEQGDDTTDDKSGGEFDTSDDDTDNTNSKNKKKQQNKQGSNNTKPNERQNQAGTQLLPQTVRSVFTQPSPIPLPPRLIRSLYALNAYSLARRCVKNENHEEAAQHLFVAASFFLDEIERLGVSRGSGSSPGKEGSKAAEGENTPTPLLNFTATVASSAAIELHKAKMSQRCFSICRRLLKSDSAQCVAEKIKRKIELIVRKNVNPSIEPEPMRHFGDPNDSEAYQCPLCYSDLMPWELTCSTCLSTIPFYSNTNTHVTKSSYSECPVCFMPIDSSLTRPGDMCSMCGCVFDSGITEFVTLTNKAQKQGTTRRSYSDKCSTAIQQLLSKSIRGTVPPNDNDITLQGGKENRMIHFQPDDAQMRIRLWSEGK